MRRTETVKITNASLENLNNLDNDTVSKETVRNDGPKVGRNDPCPCGSGKKYKNCCGKQYKTRKKLNLRKVTNLLFVNQQIKMWTKSIEIK